MRRTRGWSYAVATILAAAGVTFSASAASADFTVHFAAGQACSFALDVSGTGGNRVTPPHATGGKVISGGTGSALTFSGNGKSVSFPSNGAVTITQTRAGGASTLELMGHNVVFLFPTDNPAGPSTTLIVGREVINVDSAGNFDVLSVSGTQTNICALLS